MSAERLRGLAREEGWPTPNSMRRAADALDIIAIPKFGDALRAVADVLDAPAPPVTVRRGDYNRGRLALRDYELNPTATTVTECRVALRALIDNADTGDDA